MRFHLFMLPTVGAPAELARGMASSWSAIRTP